MAEYDRTCLFNVLEPFEMPEENYEQLWPLVSNIWTVFSSGYPKNSDEWAVYACRFLKHRQSSTRQEGIVPEKRRKTNIRNAQQCFAKIRVTKVSSSKTVRIEPYKNEVHLHTHPIENNDILKKSKAIRELVTTEAMKNYRPPAITLSIREIAETKLGEGSGVEFLRTKEVANIQRIVRGPSNVHLIGNEILDMDISEAIKYLLDNGYRVEEISSSASASFSSSSGDSSFKRGFVFATPEQLENLSYHGWLTLIDSTHKTNKWEWRLFTLYIRDNIGCWNVGGHFFVEGENSAILTKALNIIRMFAPNWSPRYMLPDQSAIEANAINNVFRGIEAGEMECTVILCTVHVMRTWMGKVYGDDVRNKMILAMHRRTRVGCDENVQEAINLAPTAVVKNYIKNHYSKNTEKWALWARQHSPLLLQVTTTNAIESYHSELKSTTSHTHGLIGACMKITKLDNKKSQDAKRAQLQSRTRKLSVAAVDDIVLAQIHKFPFLIQRLIADEALAVMRRIEKGKPAPGLIMAECHCRFFTHYLVPCRHIFHEHFYGTTRLLTEQAWEDFQDIFAEAGYSVYECREVVEVPEYETEEQRQAETLRLRMNEITERIRDSFWRLLGDGNNARTEQFLEEVWASVEPSLIAYH